MYEYDTGAGVGITAMLLLTLVPVYFLPLIIAAARNHRNLAGLFALNLFLGWMLVGWVVALVWSLAAQEPQRPAGNRPRPRSRNDERVGGWREDPHNNANPFQFD